MGELNSTLKIAIFQAKISNKDLAERVGIHPTNMSAIVNGKVPHLRTAQMIVRELNELLDSDKKVSIDMLWPLPPKEDK